MGTKIDKLDDIVPEISINVPPSATIVLTKVTAASLPSTSFKPVLTE